MLIRASEIPVESSGRVRSTGCGKSLERLDHTHYSTEKTNESTKSGKGSNDGEVLLEGRHFESCCFLNFLLEVGNLLLLGKNGVLVHLLVTYESGAYYSGYRTLLVGAKFLSTGDVTFLEASLNTGNKLGDRAFTLS